MTDLAAFLADLGRSQYGWPESLQHTYDTTRKLIADGIKGDLVECGVGAGVHPAVMARACLDAREVRTVRLFDSFVGLPNGGERDRNWNEHWGDGSGTLEATGISACSLDEVKGNLERWGTPKSVHLDYQVGWFQDTVPAYAERAVNHIAFLRLDGDLYESTRVCLEWLYPLVSPGGIVVLDDYNLDGARDALHDYFNAMRSYRSSPTDPPLTEITASGDVYWTKP